MKPIQLLSSLIITLVLSSCASSIDHKAIESSLNESMGSWMGHHQSDLIARWGPPQRVMDDGQGGKIFIYTATRSFLTPGSSTTTVTGSTCGYLDSSQGTASGYTIYNPPQTITYNAYRMFWINQNGRVYRWSWKGL